MPESNPNTGECSGRNLQKEIATNAEGFNLFLAAVGGGRSDCIAVESVCGLAVYLAFALHGLAHFSRISFLSMPVALGATNRTLISKVKTKNVQCRKGGTLLAGGTTYGGTQLAVGTTRRHMRTR